MSASLRQRAEVLKLARLLAVEVDRLPPLGTVSAPDLERLRAQMTDRLFDESAGTLARAGLAARLVPSALIATIAQRAFAPLLAARTAASLDPAKAVDVARRLEPAYLADVSVQLDPRRVADVLSQVPESLAVSVTVELAARGEHVGMGRFLAFVPDGPLAAAMAALDDEAMLRTAFVLEDPDRLDHAVGLLAPGRVATLLRCAAERGLWPQALGLLAHLSPERLGPIADDVAALDEHALAGLVEEAGASGLWPDLLRVVGQAGPRACARLAAMPAFHDDRVLGEVVRAAAEVDGLAADLVPLLEALPVEVRARVARLAAGLEPARLAAVVDQALAAPSSLSALVRLYLLMDPAGREVVRGVVRVAVARGRHTTGPDGA